MSLLSLRGHSAGVVALLSFLLAGCARLGYTDRVLLRIPSPDGVLVAVCQEVPAFDGPGYEVRLDHPNGHVARRLYQIGDGDPCSEIVWSPDGNTLAVLSEHVARIRFVDVKRAMSKRPVNTVLNPSRPRTDPLGRRSDDAETDWELAGADRPAGRRVA